MSYETTLEIQEKAEALDLQEAENIRSLYSKVRYGDYMPKRDEVGIFKKTNRDRMMDQLLRQLIVFRSYLFFKNVM